MTSTPDDEFAELRKRAYGPSPDIHLDPLALERLRELEEAVRPPAPRAIPVEPPVPIAVEPFQEPEPAPVEPSRWAVWAGRLWHGVRGLRRSTWLIALGAAALVAVLVTTLTLVERVQDDPLLTGAQQVARLSLDTNYDVPAFFAAYPDEVDMQIYQEFHGLRAAITTGGFYGGGSNDACLMVYSTAEAAKSTANSFMGVLRVGCAAGQFPALTQFSSDDQQMPEDLTAAFSDSTGLQFVYDSTHNEVVVFADERPK